MPDMQSFILNFLNDEPFNLNISMLQFDQMPPQHLLQTFSNILSWISDSERVDIKREAAEDTAIRILNQLRILRYPPPQDQYEQEEWRVGIVEGRKSSLYPLMVFLFENSEALKERAYLAKFLMRTEVPSEINDYDITELQNELTASMKEFREIHSELKGIMADVLLLDDIKEDLKSMEKEKMILLRKIEKTEKKVQNIPYFEKQMQLASQLRGEKARYADFAMEKQQERQKVLNIEARINRLRTQLAEAQHVADTLDEQALMEKLEDEVATNSFLANQTLFEEVETKQNKLKELGLMVRSSSVREDDIQRIIAEIEQMTRRIRKLEDERDHREEDLDENMSVFRHQVGVLERKKEVAVQRLQQMRQELNKVEKDVEERKSNLKDKIGGDVVSNVQYRKYLEQYRTKTEDQRKKRKDTEYMHSEKAVLTRTIDILNKRYSRLENHIESIGGEIVEVLNVPQKYDRPKTAAPQTNNAEDIKSDMKQMMSTLDERKDRITDQRGKRDGLRNRMREKTNNLEAMKRRREEQIAEVERNNRKTVERIRELEYEKHESRERIPLLKSDLAMLLEDKNSLSGGGNILQQQLEETQEKENTLDKQIEEMGDLDEFRTQMECWKNLQFLFEEKMSIFKEKMVSKSNFRR